MTIEEYMKLSVQGRLTYSIVKSGHKSRLDNLIKNKGKFKYDVYNDSGSYILHFKIPSETYDDIEYDSIIKLSPGKKSSLLSNSIKDYDFRFFSNSPDFVYYYCNLFYNSDMFISELSSKLPNECFDTEPTIRNKENDISNCKSLYWICLLIEELNLSNKLNLKSKSLKYNKDDFYNSIKSFDIVNNEIKISRNNKKKNQNINTQSKNTNTRKFTKNNIKTNFVKPFNTNSFIKKQKNTIKRTNNIKKW